MQMSSVDLASRKNCLCFYLHRIMSGFHGAFATGVASQQGTLTLPDTWFRPPFWDLPMLQLLRPNSSNLPCLYSTFHLEYPLVLFRFCLSQETIPKFIESQISTFTLTTSCFVLKGHRHDWDQCLFTKII